MDLSAGGDMILYIVASARLMSANLSQVSLQPRFLGQPELRVLRASSKHFVQSIELHDPLHAIM